MGERRQVTNSWITARQAHNLRGRPPLPCAPRVEKSTFSSKSMPLDSDTRSRALGERRQVTSPCKRQDVTNPWREIDNRLRARGLRQAMLVTWGPKTGEARNLRGRPPPPCAPRVEKSTFSSKSICAPHIVPNLREGERERGRERERGGEKEIGRERERGREGERESRSASNPTGREQTGGSSEEGSYVRLIDCCITQLWAQE